MTRSAKRGLLLASALLVALSLSGCIFAGDNSPRERIGDAAQQTLDALGLRAGVEMFNDAEGFAQSYSLLLCAEVPDGLDDRAVAEQLVEILNALRAMTTEESDYVNAVEVRLVPASLNASTEDLGKWCRSQWPDGLVDLTHPVSLLSTGTGRADYVEVSVPFDAVELIAADIPGEDPPPSTSEPADTPSG